MSQSIKDQRSKEAQPVTATKPGIFLKLLKNKDVLAFSGLLLLTVIYYWPILSLSGTIWNDFIEQYLPYRMFATKALKSLEFPFWNPYNFSGMPFFADLQTAVLYPFNLLVALFSSKNGTNAVLFEYQIILHIFLSGTFTYLLARSFQRTRAASTAAALVFMFGGFATTHIFHVSMTHSLPWIPLSFLFLREALQKSSIVKAVLCGLTLALLAFAGHPQMILYTHYLLGIYLLYYFFESRKQPAYIRKVLFAGMLFGIAVFTGAGISTVQLLPVRELSQESVRPEMSFEQASEGSFRPYRLITMVVPNYFGIPNRINSSASTYWGMSRNDIDPGSHYYWETALYVGIIPLLFTVLALFAFRTPPLIFFSIVSFLAFVIALGQAGGLYYLLYNFLPGFKMFRNPARIAVIFSLTSGLTLSFAFDSIMQNIRETGSPQRKKILIFLGLTGAAALCGGILFSSGAFKTSITDFIVSQGFLSNNASQITQFVQRSLYPYTAAQVWIAVTFTLLAAGVVFLYIKNFCNRRLCSLLLLAIMSLDLLSFGYGYCAVKTDPRLLYKPNDLVKSMHAEYKKEVFRFNARNSAPGRDDISGGQMIFKRNEGTVHELFLMEGYNPLRLKRQLLDRKAKMLDILNVKYKIHVDNSTGQIGIAPHPTAFPRAWFAHAYQVQSDENQILKDFYSPAFNHRTSVILEEKPEFPSGDQNETSNTTVSVTSWKKNEITADVTSDRDGFLVLSEIYYPAWKATVDNKKEKVYRADYALRAIPVPAGHHTVICRYDDASFRIGLIISLFSAVIAVTLLIVGYVREKKVS